MINTDRIVPIPKIDSILMYGLILKLAANTVPTKIDLATIDGVVSQTTNSATVLCSVPLKSLNFGSDVTAATVYFVPAYDYKGFTKTSATITTAGADVAADGVTLYSATLSTNTLTFAKVGF